MRGTHVAREPFTFEGRSYTLFKRGGEEANWEIDFWFSKRRHQQSLGTPKRALALTRAKNLIAQVKAERWGVVAPRPAPLEVARVCSPLSAVIKVYEAAAPGLELAPKTVKGAVSSLRVILATALGVDRAAVWERSADVISAKLVRDFMAATLKAAGADDEDDELSVDERAQRTKRTANSYVNQARGIFTARMLNRYSECGLVLPEEGVRGFNSEPLFGKVGKGDYHAPPADVIEKTFAELEGLRASDRNAYLAVCLACGTGMRRSEVAHARWDWFSAGEDGARVKSDRQTKNGQFISLPVLDEWWERIAPLRPTDQARLTDYVIEGTATERGDDLFRRVGVWMRGLGWRTQKTFHEFRAYVGSQIAMDPRYGMEIASLFLRHHSVDFTRKYYLRYVKLNRIDLKDFGGVNKSPE